jgi:hypothetical protein
MYQKAVALDPKWAEAYAAVGGLMKMMLTFSGVTTR